MAAVGIEEVEEGLSDKLRKQKKEIRIILMAYEMQRIASNIYYGPINNRKPFKLKIGIHRGSVIAGVIGFHKP
jgi:class 3 adenylate cyclase